MILGTGAIKITSEDIAAAHAPSPSRMVSQPAWTASTSPPRTTRSKLAVASLVVAVVGIPLLGVITGLIAIVMGSIAIARLAGTQRKGNLWAVGGILLGTADVVGWVILLWLYLGGGLLHPAVARFEPDLSALDDLSPSIRRAMLANVLVETQAGWGAFGKGTGSGIILGVVDGEAVVITNRHVIDPSFKDDGGTSADVRVTILEQPTSAARVLWVAPDGLDLAILSVPVGGAEVQAAKWQAENKSRVGDAVFAVGNPYQLGWTHTKGTISQFRIQRVGGQAVRVIQVNVSINPGNSGGGLYTEEGQLIGINTWSPDKRVTEGLGFAISFQSVWHLVPDDLRRQLEGGAEHE